MASILVNPSTVAPGQLFTAALSGGTPGGQYTFYFQAPPPLPIAQSANGLIFTANNSGFVTFSASILQTAAPGSYQLHIWDLTINQQIDVETITVTSTPPPSQANFKLNGVTPSATNVQPNTPFNLSVGVHNAGTGAGSGRIDVIAGGQVVATQSFSGIIANGSASYSLPISGISNTTTYTVNILTQENASGTYNNTDSGTTTVTVLNQPPPPGGNGGSGGGTTFDPTMVAMIAAGGIGLLVIGSLFLKGRKKLI